MRDELKDFTEDAQYVIELNDALQKEAARLRSHSIVVVPTVYQVLTAFVKDACDSAGLICYDSDDKEVGYISVAGVVSLFRKNIADIAKRLEAETEGSLREDDPHMPDERVAAILKACHHTGRTLREALLATENTAP
jgi:hypothetical protein